MESMHEIVFQVEKVL